MTKRRNKRLTYEEETEVLDNMNRTSDKTNPLLSLRIEIKCKTETQKKLLVSIRDNPITICSGRAGSGKTYVACMEALKLLKSNPDKYRKIILIKSVITLKSEEIGFLKGSLSEKIAPFMDSFIDNFDKIIGKVNFTILQSIGMIEVVPIAFARGRTFDNSIIIIDEAQNIDYENMRTLMTRIGMCSETESSKMIILGDVKQKDLKNKRSSSLEIVLKEFENTNGFGTLTMYNEGDVVRNPLIKIIEEKFDAIEEAKEALRKKNTDN